VLTCWEPNGECELVDSSRLAEGLSHGAVKIGEVIVQMGRRVSSAITQSRDTDLRPPSSHSGTAEDSDPRSEEECALHGDGGVAIDPLQCSEKQKASPASRGGSRPASPTYNAF
jgi:hypothetical protein